MKLIWFVIIIISVITELITSGLTFIWFVFGAGAALLAACLGMDFGIQGSLFLLISGSLLYKARPYAVSFINGRRMKNHYGSAVGQKIRVIESVSGTDSPGRVIYNNMEWLAVCSNPDEFFSAGETAIIKEISGLNLIITKNTDGL